MSAVLETRDLAVGYGGMPVVRHVDLHVRSGQLVAIVGPNGGGKSTLLKTVAGLLPPLDGEVRVGGRDLAALSLRARAREVAVLLTGRVRTEYATCREVVEAGRYPHTGRLGVLGDEDLRAVDAALALVGIEGLAGRDFMQLSDGQRQRVLLARAICQETPALLLDEPTSHLDIRHQIELLRVLRDVAATRGTGVLMVLHELPLAREGADWLVCVRDGGVLCQGTPDEVFCSGRIEELFDLAPGMYDPATGAVHVRGRGWHA